ncbi:MAG TPA: SET domain-containing protein-lysine N-methyltransferase [Acidimicrobiales bacterium]|nr:SET domain-containing protein-lysine N-methyltransferase [Acidimicrobiales bacterium]
MEDRSRRDGLAVRVSPGAGRGVFATRDRHAGEVLEVAPILLIPEAQRDAALATIVRRYAWGWDGGLAVGLGLISVVNHGVPANARWESDREACELWLVATAAIAAGAEVLVDYSHGGERELAFTPRPA